MKKLIYGLLLSCLPVVGMAQDKSLMYTEISIKPLEAAFVVKGGVQGTEAQFEVNGKKVTQHLIHITGEVAEDLVNSANAGIKQAGKASLYVFDKSTQMVVFSGDLARTILDESTKNSLKAIQAGSELAASGARTVFYNTVMLTAMARVHAKYALEMAAGVGERALRSLYGNIKYIAKETHEASQKMYAFTISKIKQSIEFSKNLILDGADASVALARASLLFVTDAGVYLYNNASKTILKVASMTATGAIELGKGIQTVTVKGATAAVNLIQNVYEKLPRVSVSVEFQ